jgi:hypothetical protein
MKEPVSTGFFILSEKEKNITAIFIQNHLREMVNAIK